MQVLKQINSSEIINKLLGEMCEANHKLLSNFTLSRSHIAYNISRIFVKKLIYFSILLFNISYAWTILATKAENSTTSLLSEIRKFLKFSNKFVNREKIAIVETVTNTLICSEFSRVEDVIY